MADAPSNVPQNMAPVTAHLVVPSVDDAVKFYTNVFGAVERQRNAGPDGKVWHSEVLISGVRVLLMETFQDMGLIARSPSPTSRERQEDHVMLNVVVDDVDGTFRKATGAGADSMIEPHDAFWGDRYAEFRGPDGQRWAISRRKQELSPDEQQARADQFRAAAPGGRGGPATTPSVGLRQQGVGGKASEGKAGPTNGGGGGERNKR